MAHPARPNAKPVAELIGASLDPLVRKRGLARAELVAWWPDIVGEAYAGRTIPERIRWPRDGTAATLVVHCDPALALQFSYELERVRERLNGYFGYPAVGKVRVLQRLFRAGRTAAPKPLREAEIPPALEERLARLDPSLANALRVLGRRVLAGS